MKVRQVVVVVVVVEIKKVKHSKLSPGVLHCTDTGKRKEDTEER